MKNFSTWMLVMFMVIFWVFRVMVAVAAQFKWDFAGIEPINQQVEIILLFVVLICIILIVKRKMVGALLYLLAYGLYFGVDLTTNIQVVLNALETVDINSYMNIFISIIGIVLPLGVLFDMLMDKGRKLHPKDKKTDWFYTNEKFDRQLDERADKNNYRTL